MTKTRPLYFGIISKLYLFTLLLPAGAYGGIQSAKEIVGKVIKVEGQAWITHGSVANKKSPLTSKTPLHLNDILITGKAANLTVTLGDLEAAILIKPESAVKLTQTTGKDKQKVWLLDLKQGAMLSHIRKIELTGATRFRVKTPAATLGVRGTTFFVKTLPHKELFLCTCNGTVAIDEQTVISSVHHDHPKVLKNGKEELESRLIDASVGTDHADSEAGELSSLLISSE